jgi:hypothetical protein
MNKNLNRLMNRNNPEYPEYDKLDESYKFGDSNV